MSVDVSDVITVLRRAGRAGAWCGVLALSPLIGAVAILLAGITAAGVWIAMWFFVLPEWVGTRAAPSPRGMRAEHGRGRVSDIGTLIRSWNMDAFWNVAQRGVALCILVACAPILIVIAILIKATSKGPVVFCQERPGFRQESFSALKFRTMFIGSERATRLGVSSSDPRITPIGRVLRATKLDELPQLINIVRGDMTFVGPRPLPAALDSTLREHIQGFEHRYAVRPGLTSLAQVCVTDNGTDDRLIEDWTRRFEAERRYIRNKSAAYDLLVIGLTVAYVCRKVVVR